MLSLALLSLGPSVALAASSAYAPSFTTCPNETLVRSADGISASEASWITSRKANADIALQTWLATALPDVDTTSLPTIALSSSGGGFRAFLVGAGVIKAFDSRDSNASTAGLYQALTYHAALSGGAWLLSSLITGNWPTISSLEATVWESQLAGGILNSSSSTTVADYDQIAEDIIAKASAGFPVSLVDAWGRELSYQIMAGGQGTAGFTMSNITSLSNFTSFNVPFPIMTATKINFLTGECVPSETEAIFEFNPYEFGSWSDDVSAFVSTQYLGSNFTNGLASECAVGFDRVDWVMGTSSDILEEFICDTALQIDVTEDFPTSIVGIIEEYTSTTEYGYSILANPFKSFNSTTATTTSSISGLDTLYLVDGGEPEHNDPILPLLEPSRNVSVLIISDNGNDEDDYPDGAALVAAYEATLTGRLAGRFPQVPAVGNFSTKQAQFFGCDEPDAVTVIYLPNADWTFASNTSTLQLEYTATETEAIITDGYEVAAQGGDEAWATCLACGLVVKEVGSASLPSECGACLSEYCWYS
ncbi:FabD/lysophospholipase-like protein [Cryphonectria parasitica EP155]|uniref:Lysophospholipase n=1 Tax=Cryphonectria parasitica (strain ATCC 38755 / EP155) TaxID=660469 RepID=A0A9P4XRU0_CRYP1|nr:FabD/lysophospholipase-like protein [Cryphonectria parasitica EP155]KAF3759913.1 FabD/lysophospholipase-like protein [Cryphonectria parasitica EP155]